jgi:hypothetical protein
MKHRISRFSVHQSAKTLAFVYFVLGFIYIPIGYLVDVSAPPDERVGWLWFLGPIVFALVGYLSVALVCALYNLIAGQTGGVEFTLTSEGSDPSLGV